MVYFSRYFLVFRFYRAGCILPCLLLDLWIRTTVPSTVPIIISTSSIPAIISTSFISASTFSVIISATTISCFRSASFSWFISITSFPWLVPITSFPWLISSTFSGLIPSAVPWFRSSSVSGIVATSFPWVVSSTVPWTFPWLVSSAIPWFRSASVPWVVSTSFPAFISSTVPRIVPNRIPGVIPAVPSIIPRVPVRSGRVITRIRSLRRILIVRIVIIRSKSLFRRRRGRIEIIHGGAFPLCRMGLIWIEKGFQLARMEAQLQGNVSAQLVFEFLARETGSRGKSTAEKRGIERNEFLGDVGNGTAQKITSVL